MHRLPHEHSRKTGGKDRKYEITVDNVVPANVLTADGELLHASTDSHKNPSRAIRGGDFGIVTLFEFVLHRVKPVIYCGLVMQPIEQAKDALVYYHSAT